jgi:Super-infection exclusion protein B
LLEGIISAIVKWTSDHLSPRYLIVTAFITGFLLFSPPYVLAYFGLTTIAAKYRGVIAIVFFASALLTITYPIEVEYRDRMSKMAIRKYLRDIPGGERNLIRRCVLNDGAATAVAQDLGPARSLEKQGILWQSANMGGHLGFNITPLAYRVLKEPQFVRQFTPEKIDEP